MPLKLCKSCWLYFDALEIEKLKGKFICRECLEQKDYAPYQKAVEKLEVPTETLPTKTMRDLKEEFDLEEDSTL